MMLWTPKNHLIGDITIIRVGEEYHLFTEQFPVEILHGLVAAGTRTVGHAVSKDLFHWEELPPTIACGGPGEFDAYNIFHMDVFVQAGTWFMHYTGLDKGGPGQQQSMGLATSRDGIHWTKHPANPVLRADLRWYEPAIPREATYQEKDFGRLWFRDPCIVRLPGGGFGMIVIARDPLQPPDVRGCIAWATSQDLVRWEPHPPIYSPARFHTLETPSIFEHGGRHYLIYMTHPAWGSPVMATDPYQTAGDFYAISENSPCGPWRQPEDEVLVAAHARMRMGAARTVEAPDGGRYLYGWLALGAGGDDLEPPPEKSKVVPPPRRIRFLDDGQMQVVYESRIESFGRFVPVRQAISAAEGERWKTQEGVVGKNFGGTSMAWLLQEQDDFIFSARVGFRFGERAGLVFRARQADGEGLQAMADRRFGRMEFGVCGRREFIDARLWKPREEVEIKVVALGPSIEIYADDRLMIHQVRHREKSGSLGYMVDRAEASFREARVTSLATV
ncbi:MAG: hypothetical protein HY360_06470 [Verrucomicrobia bacterium]|nr:hypothetical protein [Verrucomicrobiota bacterium]